MVQLIVGKKGKGKTKQLLDKVNNEVQSVSGNIVYLDKSTKHMYELNNKIRLIDVSSYLITSPEEFLGFVCGIVSQDHDLQQMYFDSLHAQKMLRSSLSSKSLMLLEKSLELILYLVFPVTKRNFLLH